MVWKKPADEEAARKALREQFAERGSMEALSGRIRFLVLADRRIDSGEVCRANDGWREMMRVSEVHAVAGDSGLNDGAAGNHSAARVAIMP